MKKIFFLGALCIYLLAGAQPQRLLLLPSAMNVVRNEAGMASTLCIDFFRPVPKATDRLEPLIKNGVSGTGPTVETYLRGTGKPSTGALKNISRNREQAMIFGTRNAESTVPEHYQRFIDQRVDYYRRQYAGRNFTATAHERLQEDIWEYNILDVLGFVNHEGDALENFRNARTQFKTAYADKYRSALDFGDVVSYAAGMIKVAQRNTAFANDVLFVYKVPGNRFVLFDGEGHLLKTGNSTEEITSHIIQRSAEKENTYLMLMDFENDVRRESFITNANLEGFRSGKKISFQQYEGLDLLLTGKHFYIPRAYSESNITTTTFRGRSYEHCSFEFRDFSKTDFRAHVDAYALSRPVLVDMINEVNKSFSIGAVVDNLKRKLSLNKFLYNFKTKVKALHNLQSEEEFMILVKGQSGAAKIVMLSPCIEPKERFETK